MEINKSYEPQEIEKKWYAHWEAGGYFKPRKIAGKQPFTILIPPPNVTGILHIGHVLNNTLQDVVVRYHRMLGEPTLWLPGVDHAGIATQNMVEKQIAKEGLSRHDIGREKLLEMIWAWKHEKGDIIIDQLKLLGSSCDWSRQRFTMDETLSRAVKEVFVSLYQSGLIYKGKYIINWCPRCVTALANDEVEHNDETGSLWHIRYPLSDGSGQMVVATTRPETMLGDTAVAVNPKDDRYKHLIGKTIDLPLTGRVIPIIPDEYVEMEFGTGCVKVTPAHDPNDFEIGRRHDLEQLLVMDEHGIMNAAAGADFEGMDRYACRKKVVEMLDQSGLMDKIEKHDHAVGHCYRCDTVIEPYLSDQWFVKMKPLAERAIEVVESGEVRFQPERWTKVYMYWMTNIRDWCISRQIWWGHRIPAYYCNHCEYMAVAKEMPEACPQCGSLSFRQDEDVLDTWFSSWLWPFSTMGWPDETEDLAYFLPTNVLITAPEIIYLWVARMIMSTLHFKDMIPFDTVLLHGTVRDELGRKMSKSLGNSPDPIDIIAKVGADALRFSMIFNTPKGADVVYSDSILETGRNFANKIWNAYRLIMMNIEEGTYFHKQKLPKRRTIIDQWIYSQLRKTIREVTDAYNNLQLNDAAQAIYKFFWGDFCSVYIEVNKSKLHARRKPITYFMLDILQQSMRLLHPIMPFITEEIWQSIKMMFPIQENALIVANFPKCSPSKISKQKEEFVQFAQESASAVLNIRSEKNIDPRKRVELNVRLSESDNAIINQFMLTLKQAQYSQYTDPGLYNRILQQYISIKSHTNMFIPDSMIKEMESSYKTLKRMFSNHSSREPGNYMELMSHSIRETEKLLKMADTSIKAMKDVSNQYKSYMSAIAKASASFENFGYPKPPRSISKIVKNVEINLHLDGLIDIEKERARLMSQIEKLEKEVAVINAKLANPNFINNAKAEVIDSERTRFAEASTKLSLTKELLSDLE